MRKYLLSTIILLTTASIAKADDPKDSVYICTGSMSDKIKVGVNI